VFPKGIPFQYWEQYIGLRENFWRGVGLVFGAILVMIIPFVVNPVAALIVVSVIFCTVIEIFGMLGAAGIKFSAIPAVSILMSIGISVEFAAHLTLAFHIELHGSRDERVRITLHRMLVPVLQGGLSTFFSIMLLGFSEFDFVRRYFFFIFLMVCLIGLFNGLVFLPVVLSVIGPNVRECCPRICDDENAALAAEEGEDGDLDRVPAVIETKSGDVEMAMYPEKYAEQLVLAVGMPVGLGQGQWGRTVLTGHVAALAREEDGMVEVRLDWCLAGGQRAVLFTPTRRLSAVVEVDNSEGTEVAGEEEEVVVVVVGDASSSAAAGHLPPPSKKKKNKNEKRKKRKSKAAQRGGGADEEENKAS
jgi:hypothetical protein